jgi:hypothetical protein
MTRTLFPTILRNALLDAARHDTRGDPTLLAKLTTADGQVLYPIGLHDRDEDGYWMTCFNPEHVGGYQVIKTGGLKGPTLCVDFEPLKLSHLDPAWLAEAEAMDPDDWPC